MTRRARSRSIAISPPVRRSTASRVHKAAWGWTRRGGSADRRGVAAGAAPESGGFEALSGPRGVADDLKNSGISPAIEKQLNDLGIFHYWQIAALDKANAHRIGEEVVFRAA